VYSLAKILTENSASKLALIAEEILFVEFDGIKRLERKAGRVCP